MKVSTLFITLFFLTQVNHGSSQKTLSELNNTLFIKHPPLEIVGEVDGNVLYARAFDFYRANVVDLYAIESKDFVKKESIQLPEDYILQLFIYKENYFLFTSGIKTGDYYLLQLDSDLSEINRVKLLDKHDGFSAKKTVPIHCRYFQKEHMIGISVKRTRNMFLVIDLESMTFASHISDLKNDAEYAIEDCLFGDGLDAVFALRSIKNEALIICRKQNHKNVLIPYNNKKTKDYCRSFKFVTSNETIYLASLYINKSKNEQGYSLTLIPDFNFNSLEIICFPDLTLNNPAIWTRGQYKKVEKGKLPIKNYSQKIVSAEIHQGSLLIKTQEGHEMGKRNILISSIDLSAKIPKVKWTYINHFIVDNYLTYNTMSGGHNFVSFISGEELHVIYNAQTNHLTKDGKVDLSGSEDLSENSFSRQDSRLVRARINLESGEFESRTIEPFENSHYLGKLTSPNYEIQNNQLVLLLANIAFATFQFSEPTIVSIPLDE